MYLVDPLKKLLPAIVDFDLINSGKTRFTLGLTTVQTGQMRYFDNKKEKIGLEHVLGSSALPPGFPAVLIDGEYYWDGGVYSNSPIEVVFDKDPRRSSVVFAVQIWHARGPRPKSLSHAFMREKDILFGTRSKTHIMRQAQLHRMRRIIRELVDMLPEEQKKSPRRGSASPLAGGLRRHLPPLVSPSMGCALISTRCMVVVQLQPASSLTKRRKIWPTSSYLAADTKGVLKSEMRQRHIKWIVNAKVDKVDADKMHVTEVDEDGKPKKAHELPFKFSMMIPAFRGIAAVRGVEGLANPRGFIVVDKHQRNPKYRNVFGVGVCIAIAPLEQTPLPVGVPKTGYMIKFMVTATALNIGQLVRGEEATHGLPGTPFVLPISAIPASPLWPCRKIHRAMSIGRRAAAGFMWPR